jgi:SpoVK/Ycf46/Vps4 family AAA+-type ATPase
LIASVRNRRTIFEEWGFGEKITKGRGICALFRGDSGTGKTLSAEIIANELGMTLYRVRIPAIISKYVGETEKNLEKCFREAAASGALLLFDEADSIFSKRTEVKDSNDRYANMEVNLLLQEVERFEGVVILTTNLDAAIDDAFERRLNHKIDFPFPEARYRARIWKRLLPANAPLANDIDFEILGKDLELSGGCIKNSVIRAAYRAAERKIPIDMDLLEAAGIQEYREMGKLVPTRANPWD